MAIRNHNSAFNRVEYRIERRGRERLACDSVATGCGVGRHCIRDTLSSVEMHERNTRASSLGIIPLGL